MRCPTNYITIVRGFAGHYGVDFGWYSEKHHNQPIYAVHDGTVIYNRYQKSGGYVIIIRHDDIGYCTVYGHLLKDSQLVKEGDKVKEGQQIAKMGATGQVTGEHLHFALYKGTTVKISKADQMSCYVDPLPHLNVHDGQVIIARDRDKIRLVKHVTAKNGINVRNKASIFGKKLYEVGYQHEIENHGVTKGWNIVDEFKGHYCSNKYVY